MDARRIRLLLILLRLGFGVAIIIYYWNFIDGSEVMKVPVVVMIYCMLYIALQIAKRYVLKEQLWYDWLYYIGLSAILIPVLVTNDSNSNLMNMLADMGVLFFAIPLLLEGQTLIKPKG